MFRRYDENGYERYNDYPRDIYGGMDEYPNYWHQPEDLETQYREAGMVLCKKTWTWVLPHQLENDQ
tara:strand:- start:621 stop:818 length:198 start_codon:yes stop_codon:yes gene_type:complete